MTERRTPVGRAPRVGGGGSVAQPARDRSPALRPRARVHVGFVDASGRQRSLAARVLQVREDGVTLRLPVAADGGAAWPAVGNELALWPDRGGTAFTATARALARARGGPAVVVTTPPRPGATVTFRRFARVTVDLAASGLSGGGGGARAAWQALRRRLPWRTSSSPRRSAGADPADGPGAGETGAGPRVSLAWRGRVVDLGPGGCRLILDPERRVRPGQVLRLTLELPGSIRPLALTGGVLRVDADPRGHRVALAFRDLAEEQRHELLRYVLGRQGAGGGGGG